MVKTQSLSVQIKGLSEERAEKLNAMKSLAGIAGQRNLTKEEDADFQKLKSEVEELNQRLLVLNDQQQISIRDAVPVGESSVKKINEEEEERSFSFDILKRVPHDNKKPLSDFYLRNFDVDQQIQKTNPWKVLRALATGKTHDTATSKALDEMRSFSGSALLNPYLSANIWDGSLAKSRLAQAGMKTIPLESNTHKFAQVSAYPSFEWKAESATTTARTTTFTNRQFEAKTLRGFFSVPAETLYYASNGETAIKNVCLKAAAAEIDRAGLNGSGTGAEPEGILQYTNLNTYSLGNNGGQLDYDAFYEVIQKIHDDNEDSPTAAIMSPREWKRLQSLQDLQGNSVIFHETLKNIQMFQTTNIPTTLDAGTATGVASAVVVGGFEKLYLGIGWDIRVQISPIVPETGEYKFYLSFNGDFLPEREEAFGAITNVIP